jgi:hypothetical protein
MWESAPPQVDLIDNEHKHVEGRVHPPYGCEIEKDATSLCQSCVPNEGCLCI